MNKNFGIKYFDVALFMKGKQRRNKKKESDKKRNQKKAKKKDKKEGRKKSERERQRKRKWKRGRQKRPGRKKGKHSTINRKVPFLGEKQGFSIKDKERKGKKNQTKKQQQR